MVRKIERDYGRFREIIKGNIKKDFKRYMGHGELIARHGKYIVAIPLKHIRVPIFRFSDQDKSGLGQGEGELGQSVAVEPGTGHGAGDMPSNHILEVEVTIEELTKIMEEELGLPQIKPRGKDVILAPHHMYNTVSRVGPESLKHFKRTFKEALKRQIAMGTYDPDNPVIVPTREDRRYKYWKIKEVPQNNAVLIYMMDISGSMGDEQKELVRTEAFWIDTWLRSQYKKIETRYIVHDAVAWEVDRDTFFKIRESGGTKISSAYELCRKIVNEHYDTQTWNIYPFHFSDGDNWGQEDTKKCIDVLKSALLLSCNMFCYGQVRSTYGSGQFKKDLDESFPGDDRIITSEIKDRSNIFESIKDFLGKGK